MTKETPEAPPRLDGRARRKLATRRALRQATLELGLERGLDEVTVDEIAERAGVSTRTFFNYFDAKEDAALIELFQLSDRELDELATGDASAERGSVWHELTRLFLTDVERVEHEGRDLPRFMALQDQTPNLQARQQGRFMQFIVRLSLAVERRLGDSPEQRVRAGVMAGSCMTAVRVGLGEWARSGWEGSAGGHVAEAFAAFDKAFADDD